jgi:DNA-binding transcriptional MocR family regulator
VLNIFDECDAAGNSNMVFGFCSTSKVTFPGSGIAAFTSSEENVAELLAGMGVQTIGFDKINQLRHTRFLKDANGVAQHMSKHAALLRPRFQAVFDIFEEDFAGTGVAAWTKPNGGYFISFTGLEGTAKATVAKASEAGVILTSAGATWPYHDDPHDADIRIAPSFPSLDDLKQAARVFTVCARMAALEKIMQHT